MGWLTNSGIYNGGMKTYTITVPSGKHSITLTDDTDTDFVFDILVATGDLTATDVQYIYDNNLDFTVT